MSDQFEEQNYGEKGRFLLYFFVGFFLFIAMIIYVYQRNFVDIVPVG